MVFHTLVKVLVKFLVVLIGLYIVLKMVKIFCQLRKGLKSFHGKIVVITGGAGGLGKCLVKEFLKEGSVVVIIDINKEEMEKTVKELNAGDSRIHSYICDIGDREKVYKLSERIKKEVGLVNVLFNNAGIAHKMPVAELDYGGILSFEDKKAELMVKVNFVSHLWTIKAFLPQIIDSEEDGHLVTIGSLASFMGSPGMGVYCGTKGGSFNLLESVGLYEMKKKRKAKIDYTIICPAFIDTPMIHVADKELVRLGHKTIGERFEVMSPEFVAKEALNAMKRRENVVTLPKKLGVLIHGVRFFSSIFSFL